MTKESNALVRKNETGLIWKVILVVLLFITVLTAFRFIWVYMFEDKDDTHITEGELDLRNIELGDDIVGLDGEWEFYPGTFVNKEGDQADEESSFIHVPGNWNNHMHSNDEEEIAYGYGSYRLRILVDPEEEATYSIRVPSVRSSSELYVNGKLLAHSGEVGETKQTYVAENLPYSVYFTDDDGVIDIVIHVANFQDTRGGGLVRSIKFGHEEVLSNRTNISTGLQQLILVILILHSLYAVILYVLGNRDKRLVYFSLFILSATVLLGLSFEEKLIHKWLQISYDASFRLSTITLITIGYFLYKSVEREIPVVWKNQSTVYALACFVSIGSLLILPVHTFLDIQFIYYILMYAAFVLAICAVFRLSIQHIKRNLLLLLSLIAFLNNIFWTFNDLFFGIKVIYYPFDLIIAVICLAGFWFQQYFDIYKEANRISLKLQEADKTKDEFLANTSHELRNPLHAILNMSQVVLEREQDHIQEDSVKDLETVLSVGRRMSTMLNDLLDVMVLKEKTQMLHQQSFHVQSIPNGVFNMLDHMIERKDVTFVNRLPEDFPPVYGDEDRVIQVLFNLLHNSVKHTNEGTISVEGYVESDRAYIIVVDTGAGIDKKTLETIFEPYEQSRKNGSMVEGGFGLGLSISQQLIELHGGLLEVESELGKGSKFNFSLPLSDETIEGDAQTEVAVTTQHITDVAKEREGIAFEGLPLPEMDDAFTSVDRPRVLVVDDDPVNLQVVQSVLSVEKYDMTTVLSGEEALDLLHKKDWDLVIADVMMPNMSGYQLTRNIRKRFTVSQLPVVLLTARNQMKDIEQGFLSGANDYIAKPVDSLELRSRVRALTSVRRSMREHLRMEAAWLQAQIQPHFLFNALNTIMALSEIDPTRMQRVLEAFSDFLRGKFNFQNVDDLISIQDEIELIKAYLYIEKERFGDRLQIEWETDDVSDVYIPPLTIQPLVENAIHHGIMSQIEGGVLRISIQKEDQFVRISVEDDGSGMTQEERERLLQRENEGRTGVGLLNTHLRLKRQFNSGLDISSEQGKGTTVTFTVPLLDEQDDYFLTR